MCESHIVAKGYFVVVVQDYGEVYEYPYESIEAAQNYMGKCSLACTLWACTQDRQRMLICEQAAS